MSVGLDITGTTTSRRTTIRAGEVAVVGRSPWADVSLPEEPELADEHFRIDCTGRECRVTPIDGLVLRNGVMTDGAALASSDVLTAGGVEIRVCVTGLTHGGDSFPVAASSATTSSAVDFEEIVGRAGLSPEALDRLVVNDPLASFDVLRTDGLVRDACCLGVAAVPAVEAMADVVEAIVASCALTEAIGVELVESLAAADAPERADAGIARTSRRSPEQWLWKAVRWQRGSLTAVGLPPVPAPPELFARGIAIAITLAVAQQKKDVWSPVLDALRLRLVAMSDESVESTSVPVEVEV